MKLTIFLISMFILQGAQAIDTSIFEPKMDDYLCRMPDDNEISGATQCFNDRKIIPYDSDQNGSRTAQIEALQSDIKACDCLLSKKFIEKNMERPEDQVLLDNVEANIHSLRSRLQAKRQVIGLQGWFLGSNREESHSLMNMYHPNEVTGVINSAFENIRENLKTRAASFMSGKLTKSYNVHEANRRIDRVTNQVRLESNRESVEKLFDATNQTCLPMTTFLLMNQIPSEKEFWQDLKGMNEFKATDWRYSTLKESLASLQKQPSTPAVESKIRGIKARLTFLNKNPMFKHLFQSTRGGILGIGTSREVHALQQKLFSSIKENLTPKGDCYNKDMSCADEVFNSEGFKKFKEQTKEIAFNQNVVDVVREETELEIKNEVRNLGRQDAWFKQDAAIDQKALTMRVHQATGHNIRQCEGSSSPVLECIPGFASYCGTLDKMRDRLNSDSNADYEDEWVNELEIDATKNLKYQEVSKNLCQDWRVNKDGHVDNFTNFKRNHCEGSTVHEVCSDREKLLSKFLSEYSVEHSFDDTKETNSGYAMAIMAMTNNSHTVVQITPDDMRDLEKGLSRQEAMSLAQNLFSAKGGGIANQVGAGTSDEGPGTFTSALRGLAQTMESQSYGSSSEDYGFPYQSSASLGADGPTQGATTAAVTEVQKLRDDAQKEKEKVETELADTRRRLDSAKEDASRNNLENRIKMLEQLLAQKDKSVNEYQKLFDKLAQEKEAGRDERVIGRDPSAPSRSPASATGIGRGAESFEELSQNQNRAPTSVAKENFSTAGSAAGNNNIGSAAFSSRGSGQSVAATRMNDALLSKYGITISGSQDGQVLVAPDKDSRSIPALTNMQDAKSLPLDVPRSQFEKFKSNDLDTLKDIYEDKLKSISGNVVKISVTTQGEKESLEFYAIKEGGKVIFQPVRKVRLNDLKLTLPST